MNHNTSISDEIFKLKQNTTQNAYLNFSLENTYYGLSVQNIINIIEKPNLIYLSHMHPPIIGLQYYNDKLISVLDFGGYRPHKKLCKLLVLTENPLLKNNPFALIVDEVFNLKYITTKELLKNKFPFNNLLPSYFYTNFDKNNNLNILDICDLANQL